MICSTSAERDTESTAAGDPVPNFGCGNIDSPDPHSNIRGRPGKCALQNNECTILRKSSKPRQLGNPARLSSPISKINAHLVFLTQFFDCIDGVRGWFALQSQSSTSNSFAFDPLPTSANGFRFAT